jgi:demethylsterigmatocystin 6-O-methyltransferase
MEAIIDQAKRVASNANENERKKIIDDLRDLSYSLETPDDTSQRIMYLVSKLDLA